MIGELAVGSSRLALALKRADERQGMIETAGGPTPPTVG